ncbi:hypothetical protein Poly41_30480 [Novipirellula artificiosorum]|uniref:Uncharacterized protein n=1 Tax=Novipirellula artificiosorum TaxID=2528016 RepID=A0A5C6DSV3_9BACT|nr:hypothetical protein Poly41_30480 [Novipirellula artificiosorum]
MIRKSPARRRNSVASRSDSKVLSETAAQAVCGLKPGLLSDLRDVIRCNRFPAAVTWRVANARAAALPWECGQSARERLFTTRSARCQHAPSHRPSVSAHARGREYTVGPRRLRSAQPLDHQNYSDGQSRWELCIWDSRAVVHQTTNGMARQRQGHTGAS